MIALQDLNVAADLDNQAMATIAGAGAWHRRSVSLVTGSFGAYKLRYKNYQGIKFHDGYLSRHYIEGWKRSRTQTEYSTWDHFVRV